jgi:hypothetical protein
MFWAPVAGKRETAPVDPVAPAVKVPVVRPVAMLTFPVVVVEKSVEATLGAVKMPPPETDRVVSIIADP